MKKRILLTMLTAIMIGTSSLAHSETLKVGASIPNAPFVHFDEQFQAIGFDVDLLREIGKVEGFDIEVVQDSFPRVFDTLKKKDIDIIANVYYSKDREADFGLSTPYYTDELRFLAPQNTLTEDFLQQNTKVYVLSFSPLESTLKEIQKNHNNIQIAPEDTSWLAFKALFKNKGSAFLTSDSNIQYFQAKYPQYQYETFDMPGDYLQTIALSWLMRKEDTALKERINSGLEKVKASGEYDKLKEKYHLP